MLRRPVMSFLSSSHRTRSSIQAENRGREEAAAAAAAEEESMGGRGRRRPQARNSSGGGSTNNKHKNIDNRRGGSASSSSFRSGLFVEGGALADWQLTSPSSSRGGNSSSNLSKSRSSVAAQASSSRSAERKPSRNVFAYQYPAVDPQEGEHGKDIYGGNEPQRVILLNSKEHQIVAYMDEEPSSEPHNLPIIYDYASDMVLGESSHRGLGFHDASDSTPSGVEASSKTREDQEESGGDLASPENGTDTAEEIAEEILFERSSTPKRNAAYLSIGGRKFYTEDLSGEDSDEGMAESGDCESLESSDSEGSVESSESNGSEDDSDSGSEIDQDVLEDYLEGIGGGETLLDSKWLLDNAIDESDKSSGSTLGETLNKLSGIALQDASKEYGMKKPSPLKKPSQSKQKFYSPNIDEQSSALDDLFLFKDQRSFSARKNRAARFPQSWPMGDQKSKRSRSFPGEKKKHRKELIAVKRRDRMLRRGVDLEKINMQLEQIVSDGIEIHSFQPMHPRDCSQIQRLAAIYQLRTICLNSGKKRFVMVERTHRTCMPSSSDKVRIEKLIGAFKEDADFPVVDVPNLMNGSAGKRSVSRTPKGSNSMKNSAHRSSSGKTSNSRRVNLPLASNPVSFVSCGIIESEILEIRDTDETVEEASGGSSSKGKTVVSIGAFEEHTTGFGSKMMAKMGFIEGKGLGKDGAGMAKPIEVIKRPKSLGLGMNFSEYGEEESSERRREPQRSRMKSPVVSNKKPSKSEGKVRSFERHRKGKDEGQVGSFEKHTKGFGSRMMAKMGFVEGEGLGRDSQGMVSPLVAVRRPKARGLGATT